MKLQSSYIFLENPDKKPTKQEKNNDENVIVLDLGKSVYCFIRSAFPDISENKSTNNRFKKEYRLAFNVGSVECTAIFIINKVKKITFLDIIVDGIKGSWICFLVLSQKSEIHRELSFHVECVALIIREDK